MGANRQQIGKCSGRQNGKFHSTHQTADPGHICCPSSSLIFAAAPQTSHIRCLSMPQVAGRLFQIAELGQHVKFDTWPEREICRRHNGDHLLQNITILFFQTETARNLNMIDSKVKPAIWCHEGQLILQKMIDVKKSGQSSDTIC